LMVIALNVSVVLVAVRIRRDRIGQ